MKHACARLQYRGTVLGDWGFDRSLAYGKGVSLLFAGPPGTGKTMSAQVLAKEVQLEIYKIDLSQVISKYIGETEKNLHEVFSEAQLSNAILFFDEADALFGKRSEVKDSHDKYSNVETAYLLQKMEEYDGITILATNLQQNLDEAFMRRFGFIVKFPFPDAGHREQIWRGLIPPEAPVDDDIDFRFLASKFELAGGYIKNIVLSAAFMAAEQGCAIGMKQLLVSARSESAEERQDLDSRGNGRVRRFGGLTQSGAKGARDLGRLYRDCRRGPHAGEAAAGAFDPRTLVPAGVDRPGFSDG
ncbi:ATP-binding protein [Paenibacillus sp. P26]|nr:ATP-binding protein [Paenibacillus sp. P26]